LPLPFKPVFSPLSIIAHATVAILKRVTDGARTRDLL
jgi:hypothetical protein